MKTISKRFLKGGLAVLLAVIMLFSSCISGLAAVVDSAQTKANSSGGYIYFVKPATWTASKVQFCIGHGSYTSAYEMTKLSGNLYYLNLKTANGGNSWNGSTYHAVIANSSNWGSGNWGSGNLTNATNYTTANSEYGFNDSNTYLITATNTAKGATITTTYKANNSTQYTTLNTAKQTVYSYSAAPGSSTYNADAAAASTLSVKTQQLSGNGTLGSATTTSKTASATSANRNAAVGTSVTVTAAAATGYTFKGWYSSSTSTTALSNSTSYTYNAGTGNTSVYAKFDKAGYSYTISAGTGGTVTPSGPGTGTSVDVTASPSNGYKFVEWVTSNGAVAVTDAVSTTFTPTANGATCQATFTPADYTVTLNPNGGTVNSGNVTGYTYGNTVTLPTNVTKAGHTFAGWYEDASFTGNAVTSITSTTYGNKTYYAKWNVNKHTITVNQNVAGGTTNIGGTTVSGTTGSAQFDYGTQVSVTVTPTGSYKISAISGAISSDESTSAVTQTFTVTGDATINVNYVLAGSCEVKFASNATKQLVIGGTYTNVASIVDPTYCTGNGSSVTYSSNAEGVATVNANGVVTAVAPGTATITAKCNTDTSATASYQVTVLEPEISFDAITLDVNDTVDADDFFSITTATKPTDDYSVSYTPITSGPVRITSAGVITAKGDTTGVNVTAKFTCGSYTKTVTFPVAVNTPTLNFNPKAVNLITGQTMTQAFTASASAGDPTITITSGDADVMTIGNDNKGTAVGAGSTTVTATFSFNDYYTLYATANVLVAAPKITADPTSVALEYGEGSTSTSATVTLDPNTADGNGTGDTITVETGNASVATATLNGTTLTITATGVGSTTVIAHFHDATVEIPVTVTKYDPYVYLYVTDSQGWDDMFLHSWKGTNSNVTTLGQTEAQMIYIGRNGDNAKVFAYRFLKGTEPEKVIMVKANNWNVANTDRTDDYAVNFSAGYAALYIASDTNSNGRRQTGDWTSSCMIVRPTVSVADVVVPVASTATATATVENGGVVYWTTADSTTATVADVTTATSTVTGEAVGNTTITARAFIDTANSSIKTLPNNYKTDSTSWPFISTEATATVTVGSVDHAVSANAKYSDGEGYIDGTTGGTVTVSDSSVSHGSNATFTASAKSGYKFVGWFDGDTLVSEDAEYTTAITAETTYTAYFVKQVTVTIVEVEGVASATINDAEYTQPVSFDAGSDITAVVTLETGYIMNGWSVKIGDNAPLTITETACSLDSITANVTLTPNIVKAYTASATAQTNKYYDTYGGTVTVNGVDSPVMAESGDEVTFEASVKDNYYFAGWYRDAEFTQFVSADSVYTETMTTSGITLYALFVKDFYVAGTLPGTTTQLVYDVATDTYSANTTYNGPNFYVQDMSSNKVDAANVNVTGGSHVGCTVAGHYTSYMITPDLDNYDPTKGVNFKLVSDGDGTYTMNITLQEADKYNVTFNGNTTQYAAGREVTLTATPEADQYLSGVSSTPAVTGISANSDTGKITFTMPAYDVTVTPAYKYYAYVVFTDSTGLTITGLKNGYEAGEEIEITVAPATEMVTITGLTAPGLTVTEDGNNYVITGTLSERQTVTVTPTVEAKFSADAEMSVIGNYGTGVTSYGTVTLTVDGETKALGTYFDNGTEVTYEAEANADYIFDGFYKTSECSLSGLLTRETTYTTTLSSDTTVYALFVRRQYIAYNKDNTGSYTEMDYDPANRWFTNSSSSVSKTANFRMSNNLSGWTDNDSYSIFDSSFSVTFNSNAFNATVGWGTQSYQLSVTEEAEYPFTFILQINGNSSIDVSVKTSKIGYSIYLSSGRLDLPGSYDSAVFNATTSFTHEGVTNPAENEVKNDTELREKYRKLNILEPQMVSFETEITGAAAANYEVDKFVVYHINTETYTIVEPNKLGNNKYNGTAYVDGDCYIVPIYFLTEEYATANDLVEIDIYFDATAIMDKSWGPFVACYAWGSGNTEYTGGWSGQLMIPSEDGSSFYAMITVPKADAENPPSVPNGVTFNNYMQSTCVGNNPGAFGVSSTQYQCYDYREPITLYEEGFDVITFVAKESTDGYHGDRGNGVSVNTVTNTTTDIFTKYEFDYLYCRDGSTPMDLNGQPITNYVDINTSKADYYIIAKGDITYDPIDANLAKYVADNNFDADWAVDWYVFNSEGEYVTNILSDAMYNVYNDEDGTTYLENALGLTAAQAAGKTIAISYEHENNANHQISYDGQWYGNKLEDTIIATAVVGLIDNDGNITVDDEDPTNIAGYGEGYIVDIETGELHQELEITLEYGEVDLSANALDGFRFVGWYTYANNRYVKVTSATVANTYISGNTTYYAIFKEIGDDEVIINNLTYDNPTDPYIPSHGGLSEMFVEVRDSNGNLVDTGAVRSNAISTAAFVPENEETYTITIYTTPLLGGEFFAWYTDSETSDGTPTYEEVMVEAGMPGSLTQVSASFTYKYDVQNPVKVINIYSDVTRVANTATLFYKYLNRFGNWRTYTVRDVPLSDDECLGYDGNNDNAYFPTYITQYVMIKGSTEVTVYGDDECDKYLSQGYAMKSSYNMVTKYAPSDEVTEAFGKITEWTITDANITLGKSTVTLEAVQNDELYTITYTEAGTTEAQTIDGYYNDLVRIEAAGYDGGEWGVGNPFSHWEEYNAETDDWEFLSFERYYNYRIIEDKTIRAVYGTDLTDEWMPRIDSVTYTREFGDDGDFIYTDYLVAFNNIRTLDLNNIKTEQNIKYGLVLVQDWQYRYSGTGAVEYPSTSVANIETYVRNAASEEMNYSPDQGLTRCYHYDMTDEPTTNLNRLYHYLSYDLNNGKYDYGQFAFTTYAYIKVDGEIYISNGMDVNFYELAHEETSSVAEN